MTCRDALEFIPDYLDGSLSLRQRLSFDFHLFLCRHCRSYLDSYCKTIRASRDALADQVQCKELPEDLVHAILARQKQDRRVE